MGAIVFSDRFFERYLLDNFDYDNDGRISADDASQVVSMQIDGEIVPHITNLQGIEHFTNLRELTVQHTKISTLDISRNENLECLNCSDNQLERLNLGRHSKLKRLYCNGNRLTELDLTNKRQLIVLLCGDNLLTELNASVSPLMFLRCENNRLAELNLSKNKHLIDVQFNGNPLERLSLPAFYESRIEEIICNNKHLGTIKQHYTHLWNKIELFSGNDTEITIDFIPAMISPDI